MLGFCFLLNVQVYNFLYHGKHLYNWDGPLSSPTSSNEQVEELMFGSRAVWLTCITDTFASLSSSFGLWDRRQRLSEVRLVGNQQEGFCALVSDISLTAEVFVHNLFLHHRKASFSHSGMKSLLPLHAKISCSEFLCSASPLTLICSLLTYWRLAVKALLWRQLAKTNLWLPYALRYRLFFIRLGLLWENPCSLLQLHLRHFLKART